MIPVSQGSVSRLPLDYRPDVDGLRALAVLAVMWFHLVRGSSEALIVSVDMFFVISGYLITRVQCQALEQNRKQALWGFYQARIRRMFPALLLVLGFVFGWALLNWEPQALIHVSKELIASGLFVQNFWLASQIGYFDLAAFQRPLLHLWTLAIEEQFYVLWPLVLLFLYRYDKRNQVVFTVTMALALLCVCLMKQQFNPQAAHYYQPWMRAWALLAGCTLALWERNREAQDPQAIPRPLPVRLPHNSQLKLPHRLPFGLSLSFSLSLAGASLLALSFVFTNRSNHLALMVVPAVLGTALLIAAGPRAWVNQKLLSQPALVWFGLMSYPLYLWHWALKSLWLQSDLRLELELTARIASAPAAGLVPVESLAMALVSIGCAAATWYGVERPLRNRAKLPKLWIVLLALMVCFMASALWVIHRQGLIERLPKDAQGLLVDEHQEKAAYRQGECFIDRAEDFSKALTPPDACLDEAKSGRPLVVLWGDSHAAQYGHGLRPLIKAQGMGFAQLSVAACPAHSLVPAAWCKQVQTAHKQWLAKQRPTLVVIAASWALHGEDGVDALAAELALLGIKTLVIGPSPIWARSLPSMLQREALFKASLNDQFPNDMRARLADAYRSKALLPDAFVIEARMRSRLKTPMVSVLDKLCHAVEHVRSCLAVREGQPIAWDQTHLSQRGSDLLAPVLWEAIEGVLKED